MLFYRTLLERSGLPVDITHTTTLAGAHTAAKGYAKRDLPDVRIELFDVPTDKDGVLGLLMGYSPDDYPPRRTWAITDRGGLREVPNGA
jgi:hypothetical protein